MMLLWLLACGSSAPELPDRAHYLSATDGDAAACERISTQALRDDCMVRRAAGLASVGDERAATRECEAIESAVWREECWFLTTDELGLTGPAALTRCDKAGQWRPHCRGHALGRAATTLAADYALGQEAALEEALVVLVGEYRPRPGPQQRRVLARSLLAGVIAHRQPELFDLGPCGTADELLCRLAYRRLLEDLEKENPVCANPAAVPPTTPAARPLANKALARYCSEHGR
jgi:hypothetical protein